MASLTCLWFVWCGVDVTVTCLYILRNVPFDSGRYLWIDMLVDLEV